VHRSFDEAMLRSLREMSSANALASIAIIVKPDATFVPSKDPRTQSRQRDMLVQYQAKHIQHMQKALTQMNVQLDNVISNIVGETGQKIVRAILAGERDALSLAKLRHGGIRASQEQIVKSLQGSWREEHLFSLKQAVNLYDSYQTSIAECDEQLARVLVRLACHDDPLEPPKSGRGRALKVEKFDLRKALYRACGVDLTCRPDAGNESGVRSHASV
jgi:transposase